ncbi:MAG: protein TolR [Pseudomonadota bacterium]
MGAALDQTGGGGRRGRKRIRPVSEINVTPFVDVMLVLLIIFMVAAPLLTVGVPIDLPETRASQINQEGEPLTISVSAQGQVFVQEEEIAIEDLVPLLEALATEGVDERIFVRGDRDVDYGTVMQVMGRLNEAGYRRIALVTDQELGG